MRGWAGKALEGESHGRRDSGASGVEVVGQGLVEFEVGKRESDLDLHRLHPLAPRLLAPRRAPARDVLAAFFGAFALVKLAADLLAVAATGDSTGTEPEGPPRWVVRALARLDPEGHLAADFLDRTAKARKREWGATGADEEVY
jgi:hypothetical protein